MDDVAKRAGVSQMTVSRVMRGASASAEVVDRVTRAAAALGYVQNRIAGGLAGDSNSLVGVVLPTLKNRVFTEVLEGVVEGLGATGAQPLFAVSDYDQGKEEELLRDLLSWRPMGLIITGLEHSAAARTMLRAADMRLAEIMDIDGAPMSACFGFSHAAAGRAMARWLLDKGYRSFGYIGARLGADLRAAKRRAGFVETLREAGARLSWDHASEAPSSMGDGRRLTAAMTASPDRPEVVYYSNDDLAAGGLMHCLAEGVAVPDQLALASFNGLEFLEALPLQITTTRTPRREIGRAAALHISGDAPGSDAASIHGLGIHDLGFEIVQGETT